MPLTTVTRAHDDGAPTDTRTTVYRQFTVGTTPHGRDQWTGPPVEHTDHLTLIRTLSGWRIIGLQDEWWTAPVRERADPAVEHTRGSQRLIC